tara:strand:- start:150 stop:614 length:465 start_codon:yes stop_codon:yes gene_type:complete
LVSHTLYKKELGQFHKKKLPVNFSNSFFSSKQVLRRFPIQSTLHIALDGALIGVLTMVAIMSSVALHSQYLWTKSFTKLESTRDLNRRFLESTSILEGYLLKNQNLSGALISTRAKDLIYVEKPSKQNTQLLVNEPLKERVLKRISSLPVKAGY